MRCTIIQSTDKPISMLLTECWKYGKQIESQYNGLAEKRYITGGCRTQMFLDRCSYRILWRWKMNIELKEIDKDTLKVGGVV